MWFRAEGTVARNIDLLTQNFVPRESLSVGLNGQMSRHVAMALNVNVDRSPMPFGTGSPWGTRSTLRLTRMLPTGSARMSHAAAGPEAVSARGTGTVIGSVFADWNGNGLRESDEAALEGIPVRIGAANLATTGRDGQFSFLNVPAGAREVGLDTGSLPIDFDPPGIAQVELELARGATKRVSFGLRPLGTIEGRVTRDVNRNGRADPDEESIDGAIVMLDGGARSEQARGGYFQFSSVRSGEHRVTLLLESLPEGAVIAGDAEVTAGLTRDRMTAHVPFLVALDTRPEIRKVFPPKGGGGAAATVRGPASARRPGATQPAAPRRAAASAAQADSFAIQVAALRERINARGLLRELQAAGLPAYIITPGSPGEALYRVRVGPYRSRGAAEKARAALEKVNGSKLWVVREK